MAINIIKLPPHKFDATCKTCGTVFTYEVDDLRRDYLWGGYYVPCPGCSDKHRHPDQRGR